eukprot:CAMPEP_0197724174 /NCGR_PEP_ID=MMETSP1434-20131217/6192_1 /TAXON_ID=265543 /ORGANISM="Minutocellus polymorphus, Strain CCMP3303" /LENGTH=242 /DNA_ID=CAMNT_0043309495 /DNA_START=1 /DNA_END=729 /DNA_ORIENTATION=+
MTTPSKTHNPSTGQPQIIPALLATLGVILLFVVLFATSMPGSQSALPADPYSSSSSLTPYLLRSRQMQARPLASFALPDLNLDDEFFASPFMFDKRLVALKKEMDQQRDQMVASLRSPTTWDEAGGGYGFGSKLWEPTYKVDETDDQIAVTVSVPDVDLKDITIEIMDGRVMHISGMKRMHRKGMVSETSFDKRFALGRDVDQDHITAKLNQRKGELTVETPKLKEVEGTEKIKTIGIAEEL